MIGMDAEYDLEALAWSIDGELEADFHFFRDFILSSPPGLALDAGCGTGRLLIEYLRCGLRIEALDICPAMIQLCKQKAEAAKVSPTLYQIPIQQHDTPGRYSAIYLACGTFMYITDDAEADRCLHRLRENLAPGGRLALSIMMPLYLPLARGPLPSEWEDYYRLPLPDNRSELVVHWRAHSIDLEKRVTVEENRYRLVVDGKVTREEFHPGQHRWYTAEELTQRLERAGFKDVQVYWDYLPARKDNAHSMCVVATRS